MSNLTLKSTNYDNMVKAIRNKKGGRKGMVILGNNTEAHMLYDTEGCEAIGIFYHGNRIAFLDKSGIAFSNAGWGTSTTRNRLGIIAHDNNVPLSFGQKNFAQTLTARKRMWNGGERHLITDNFRSIVWERENDALSSAAYEIPVFAL